MRRVMTWAAALSAGLALFAAGCRTTGPMMPVDLQPGPGRVDQTFAQPIPRMALAIFQSLDDQQVRPSALSLRSREGKAIDVQRIEEVDSNLKLEDSVQDVLLDGQVVGSNNKPMRFDVVSLSYKGKTTDGRPVVLTAARRGESTRLAVQVGASTPADEAAARALLERVASAVDSGPR